MLIYIYHNVVLVFFFTWTIYQYLYMCTCRYYLPVFIHVYMYYIPLFIHMYMYLIFTSIYTCVHVLFTSICTADYIFNMEMLHVNYHRHNHVYNVSLCFNYHQWTNLKLGELIIQTFFKTFNNFQYLILFILDQDGKIMKS